MAKMTSAELLELMKQQYSNSGYKKKTDEELMAQAQQEFDAYYDQQRLSAQQQFEQQDLALQQQRQALDYEFQKQQEASAREYNQVYSQADRQMLSRGMQRSSYGAQTLANIRQKAADVYMDLEGQRAAKAENIEAQRVQLNKQHGDKMNQYDAAQAADELKRLWELQEQEYNRGVQADANNFDFGVTLYQLLKEAEEAAKKPASTSPPKKDDTTGETDTTGTSTPTLWDLLGGEQTNQQNGGFFQNVAQTFANLVNNSGPSNDVNVDTNADGAVPTKKPTTTATTTNKPSGFGQTIAQNILDMLKKQKK